MFSIRRLLISILSLLVSLLFSCGRTPTPAKGTETEIPESNQVNITLTVALYPYVPRIEQFKEELAKQWKDLAPGGVSYKLMSWDCYSEDPPANLDVFVFDAIFFDYFQSKGFLKKMTVTDQQKSNFIPFFLEGCKVGDVHYGLPQLGCANLLFYRRQDKALAEAKSLADLEKVLGNASYTTAKPPKGVGLMVDMSGGTTDSCFYIETVLDLRSRYTTHPKLPPSDQLNEHAVDNLHRVVCMAGKAGAAYEPDPHIAYERGRWFGEGFVRAVIGFSESMSVMASREDVAFKLFPLASPIVKKFFR